MKKIGVSADWHHGSRFGLANQDYVSAHNLKHSDCLMLDKDFMNNRDLMGKLDHLFLLGDHADGYNPLEHGEDSIAEENLQVEMGTRYARAFKGSPKIYVLRGSRYHRGRGGGNLDERIAHEIQAVPDKYGKQASPKRLLDIEGVRFSLAHKTTVSKSAWQYRGTPLGIRLVLSRLNRLEKDGTPYILIRAHCHTFTFLGFKTQLGVTCPCYSTDSTFVQADTPESTPDVGMLYFEVDDDKFTWKPLCRGVAPTAERA